MKLVHIIWLFLFGYSSMLSLRAQEGSLFLEDFQVAPLNIPDKIQAIQQGPGQLMYYGGSFGVYIFNGVEWDTVQCPGSVRSLRFLPQAPEKLFVGGIDFFGFIQLYPDGHRSFVSLEDQSDQNPAYRIEHICPQQDYIFFQSPARIFVRHLKDSTYKHVIKNKNSQSFSLIFAMGTKIFAALENKGLFEIASQSNSFQLREVPGARNNSFKIGIPLSDKLCLLSDSAHFVYIFDGRQVQKFTFDNQRFIQKCQLSSGIRLSSSCIALGTRLGGVLILDEKSRKTKEILNYQNNLGDDEILALGQDSQGGLWISHGQGLSRADLQIPLRDFATYPGLLGKINTSYYQGDTLFVGTNQGLYYLKQVKTYQEAQSYLKDYSRKEEKPLVKVKVYETRKETKVGNLINEVFGKQKAGKVEVIKDVPAAPTIPYSPFPDPQTERLYILKSITYVYQKVPGIEGKVNLIFPGPRGILVASHIGLYSFDHIQSQMLLPNVKVNHFLPKKDSLLHYFLASDEGLFKISYRGSYWERKEIYKSQVPLFNLVFFQNHLWASGAQSILYWSLTPPLAQQNPRKHLFSNPYQQPTRLFQHQKQLKLHTWNETYRYQNFLGILIKDGRLDPRASSEIYNDTLQSDWQPYLHLIEGFQDLQVSPDRSLWLSEVDHLWQLSGDRDPKYPFSDSLYLHSIEDARGIYYLPRKAQIPFALKSLDLRFQFNHPFFLGAKRSQYQYRLDEFQKNWTDFNTRASIRFSHLPPGDYNLQYRAKNALGQMSKVYSQRFYIKPPFWQTWWFYGLESLVLMVLVFLSYFYSRSPRVQQWSQILSILTIITLFEFIIHLIEPFVEEVSGGVPVFKLLMNIILALSLHPAERWFKSWLGRQKPHPLPEEEPI